MILLKSNILTFAHNLQKYVVGTEGNISVKHKRGFFIKASGTQLKNLSKKDLVYCDFAGRQLNNFTKKSSIETGFHAWLQKHKHIKYVAHTHPTNTLSILCTNYVDEFANNRLFPDQVVFNGEKSCIVPYSMPGDCLLKSIITHVQHFQKKENCFPKIILLKNHGIICCSSSYKECIIATEICEKAAQIFIGAKQLGKINYLTKKQILKIKADKKEIYRQNILK